VLAGIRLSPLKAAIAAAIKISLIIYMLPFSFPATHHVWLENSFKDLNMFSGLFQQAAHTYTFLVHLRSWMPKAGSGRLVSDSINPARVVFTGISFLAT
jgi:hypothetical protein